MADRDDDSTELVRTEGELEDRPDDDLPVVAQLVVEIRSDGRRTVARGAVVDAVSGERVAVEARGKSPLSLAASLARSMFGVPALARSAARALLHGRKRQGD